MHSLNNRPTGLELDDAAEIARIYKRHLLARRIRRVSRVAIIATKNDISSRQRRALKWKRQLTRFSQQLAYNQYRIAAVCALLIFSLSSFVPVFLQADTSKSITLDSRVQKLIGETRDDASKYLSFDSKTSEYAFTIPEDRSSDLSEHSGRVPNAYSTSLAQTAQEGITVTDKKTKIAVTLKSDFYTTPARKSDGNHIVYRSGNKQVIYTHKYNGLKEDIILSSPVAGSSVHTFTLKLPSGVEARLDNQGNTGIYSSDPTLFGDISFDKEQDRISVEKARENGAKTNLIMVIPYPVVKDSSGTEYSDRAKFTLSDKRTANGTAHTSGLPAVVAKTSAGKTQLNEYTLTLSADNIKNLSYPISIDPTITVRDAGDFTKLNVESGSDVDVTNSLIKRGSLTGGALGSWNINSAPLPYAVEKQGTVIYNGYMYIHGGLSGAGNDGRVYFAQIDPITGSVGTFSAASSQTITARSTHALFAYNGYMYIMGSGNSGNPVVSSATLYAKINTDGTVGTFVATTSFATGRRFASYTLSNGYVYIAGGCTAFASPVETADCTSYANTLEFAKFLPNGTLSSWSTSTSPFNDRGSFGFTSYNGNLYVSGGSNDGDLVNPSAAFGDVLMSHQNSDGTLSGWTALPSLNTRNSHRMLAYSGYLYIIGSGGHPEASYAPIYADGTIGQWASTSAFAAVTSWGALQISSNYVYYVGGHTGSSSTDEIKITAIQPAGEISTFATNATTHTTARVWYGSLAYNGYLYILGGSSGDGQCNTTTGTMADVQYAPLNSNGSVGTFSATSSFVASELASAGRCGFGLGTNNGYMYVIGGGSTTLIGAAATGHTDVLYAAINANGTLGTWTASANKFSNARTHNGGVVYNGYLYVIGGKDQAATYYDDVQYAPLNTDGSVGTFTPTTSFPIARAFLTTATYAGKLYISAGYNGTNTNDTRYAAINSDGTLASWQPTTAKPSSNVLALSFHNGEAYTYGGTQVYRSTVASNGALGVWTLMASNNSNAFRSNYQGAIYNGVLYRMGGCTSFDGSTCSAFTTTLQYAQINNGGPGNTSAWTTDSSGTFTARMDNGVVAYNGYLYVIGGCTNLSSCATSLISSVQYAPINDDGSIGTWAATASLPVALARSATTMYNGYIYVSGGHNSSTAQNITYYAQMTSTGALAANSGCGTSWCQTSASFSTGRFAHAMVVYNKRLYVINGCINGGCSTYLNSIQFGTINANGDITAWSATTTAPNDSSQYGVNAVVNNGYLYILLGSHASGFAGIYYAPINSDGTISAGAWKLSSQSYTQTRILAAAVSLNGYLYILGGGYASTSNSDVQYASFDANGELNNWQRAKDMNLVRDHHSATIYNGKIYQAGGNQNGATVNNTQYTTLQSIPRKASFSRLYDFDVGVRPTKLITRGTKPNSSVTALSYSSSSNLTNALDNTQTVSDMGYTGANSQNISLGTNRTLSRYLFLRYTLDDTLSAIFPDSGNESKVTDFDMYYIANPGDRLRGGRTFTNGVDRGLDAQPQ